MLLQNTDLATVQRALDAFAPKAMTSDAAIIYYAGHGAAIAGRSFLLPVDFSMANFDRVDKEALDTGRLVQTLNSTHSKLQLLMFDACRNNPLEDRGAKPLQKADETPPLPANTVTIYATAQGMTATDGAGDHSPFAEGVMTNIARPDIELNALIQQVVAFVLLKTGGRQSVWVAGFVHEQFYLGKIRGAGGFGGGLHGARAAGRRRAGVPEFRHGAADRCRPCRQGRSDPCGLPATRSWRGAARSLPTRRWPSISRNSRGTSR